MYAFHTFRARCFVLAIVSLLSVLQTAHADIITTLTGSIGLAPVPLEIETVHSATNVNGVVHVVGQHQGQAARQRVNLTTGVASPVEFFDSLSSAQGFGGSTVGQINNVTHLDDGRTLYLGQTTGLVSSQPTYWFDPLAPVHAFGFDTGSSGELLAASSNGTFVGTSGFVAPFYGHPDTNITTGLPNFNAASGADDISADSTFIVGDSLIWKLDEFGGYGIYTTTGFDFGLTDQPKWLGVETDGQGNTFLAGSYFDLETFTSGVGFWDINGSFIGSAATATFEDFQLIDGHLVAAVNGLDDGHLYALTDFSSINMSQILGQPMQIDALYEGSVGFVGRNGDGGMFIATATPAAVPEPSSLVMMTTALLGMLCYQWRNRRRFLAKPIVSSLTTP